MTKGSFQARIERIDANTPDFKPAIVPDTRSIIIDIAMIPVAFLVGWGSVLFAMWVQFHYLTDQGVIGFSDEALDGNFYGNIVIAIIVSLILVQVLKLKSPLCCWAEVTGFVAGLFYMHLFVEMMPSTFASLFSIEWVLYTLDYL